VRIIGLKELPRDLYLRVNAGLKMVWCWTEQRC